MNAYVYRGALFCEGCAERTVANLRYSGASESDNSDSDQWPKGPYPNGGGEADTPQCCDGCGVFLENPLTEEGGDFVCESAAPFSSGARDETWEDIAQRAETGTAEVNRNPTVADWIRFYLAPGQ